MNLSASEKATLHFYEWEYLGRGYYHFDVAVDIEPPFKPFYHKQFSYKPIDDGKVPSLWGKVINSLGDSETKEEEPEPDIIEPNQVETSKKLIGISFSFKTGQEISSVISIEFLNMLSYSNNSISFEIHGTHESITIQIVCGSEDFGRIESHIKAYFPNIQIKELNVYQLGFDFERNVGIGDLGLNDEFMRPIQTAQSFSIDPLTSIIATFDNLHFGDTALFQVIFKGVFAPWSKSIINSVSDGRGGSFFADSTDMLRCAESKVSSPLFSVVMRIVTQGENDRRTQYLAKELIRSIASVSSSEYNQLIPLSNEGYDYEQHLRNVYERTSNRLGFFLNSNELVSFVHYPNRSIVSSKLHSDAGKSKALPRDCMKQSLVIGTNTHNGIENEVSLSTESMLRHCHIIGATGVGKSTLIANMVINHMHQNDGCIILDPHGDIVEDILNRVPEHRKDDVIIIDPSDADYPLGFNLLHAHSDAEKIVLSSDLVSAFRRHSTAWGDNMTAVLSNAINTFLESENGGTLIELKRFLIEENFRNDFLENVEDSGIHYYWEHEYPLVKKGIAPLLTRIDTFLRPKIVRYMLVQKSGIDFKACIEDNMIVLIKLSQGLIGEENSYLLGSLFLSKINQVARSRQSIAKEKRQPYYVYLDEFQDFITPSITSMLSGVRKYGISLTLAHQELAQIEESKVLNSVISNPYVRICFRLGDNDAKKLESGFSFFEQNDLQSLGIGQAIMRVGSSTHDFNIQTYQLSEISNNAKEIQEYIIENTRNRYAKPKEEIIELLDSLLPKVNKKKKVKNVVFEKEEVRNPVVETKSVQKEKAQEPILNSKETKTSIPKEVQEKLIEKEQNLIKIRDHNYLQMKIRKMGQDRGFLANIEKGDPSKVDRSACYYARYVAKNIVAAKVASRCEVQVAYAIGVAKPMGVFVDTFGTGKVDDEVLAAYIEKHFDFRPAALIKELKLLRPIYRPTAAYGHFGRKEFTWEDTKRSKKVAADLLAKKAKR